MVKNLLAIQEPRVRFLHWEDPLEKGMATHSSILAWKIPWIEEPGKLYSPWRCTELDTSGQLSLFFPQGFQWCSSQLLMRKTQKTLGITSRRGFNTAHWMYAGRQEEKQDGMVSPRVKCWHLCWCGWRPTTGRHLCHWNHCPLLSAGIKSSHFWWPTPQYLARALCFLKRPFVARPKRRRVASSHFLPSRPQCVPLKSCFVAAKDFGPYDFQAFTHWNRDEGRAG